MWRQADRSGFFHQYLPFWEMTTADRRRSGALFVCEEGVIASFAQERSKLDLGDIRRIRFDGSIRGRGRAAAGSVRPSADRANNRSACHPDPRKVGGMVDR
jgi:hypothetical protein